MVRYHNGVYTSRERDIGHAFYRQVSAIIQYIGGMVILALAASQQ